MEFEMYWFTFENLTSDPKRQNNFAESELKFWVNMEQKMYWFVLKNATSDPGNKTTCRIRI